MTPSEQAIRADERRKCAEFLQFVQRITEIYNDFALRQRRLGAEFEAAIFSDLEGLYDDKEQAK